MSRQRRRFGRPLGIRRYKKIFFIATEGIKTEPSYFNMLSGDFSVVQIYCLKAKSRTSPKQVLNRMISHLHKEQLKSSDEAWIVIDRDQWKDEQLSALYKWSLQKENYGFALSNPKFEYWLLLHFEDGSGVTSSNQCSDRLKIWIPNYDKGVNSRQFGQTHINDAIRRAKQRDQPPCKDWPREMGSTTVYRLVENIYK